MEKDEVIKIYKEVIEDYQELVGFYKEFSKDLIKENQRLIKPVITIDSTEGVNTTYFRGHDD